MTEFKVDINTPSQEFSDKDIDNTIDSLSENMVIDIDLLLKDDDFSLNDYLACVTYSPEELNASRNPSGYEFIEIPNTEDLDLEEDMDQDTKIKLLLTTEAMLNTAVKGFENDNDEYSLKELIDDVHPDWRNQLDSYRNDIREVFNQVNKTEDKRSSLFEDVSEALDFSKNKRKAYNTLTIIALSAGLLSSCTEIEVIEIVNTEPAIVESTPTTEYTPTSTEAIEPTETEIPALTATPMPTNTIDPIEAEIFHPLNLSTNEEYRGFGYVLGVQEKRNSYDEGMLIMSPFTYRDYKFSYEGIRLVGDMDIRGESYTIELLLDPEESYYSTSGGTAYFLTDREVIENWYIKGKEYFFYAFPTDKNTGALVPPSCLDSTNEEWKEIRLLFEDILTNGGENEDYYLVLRSTDPR